MGDYHRFGIPDLGFTAVESPFRRSGHQVNFRADYHFPNSKDRVFASYWYTRPKWGDNPLYPDYTLDTFDTVHSASFVHTRTFSPSILNEARFATIDFPWDGVHPKLDNIKHRPYVNSDDGWGLPTLTESIYHSCTYQFADVFSINRGRYAIKMGMDYRRGLLTAGWPNPPGYQFASILEFANDNPYEEYRSIDAATGATDARTHLPMRSGDFSIFLQNTWQIRPNLTLNYGLRWETFTPIWIRDRVNSQPVLTSAQVTDRSAIEAANNQRVDQLYSRDWKNFGPRVGLAWDPTSEGKMSVRFGLGVLYDEVNTFPLYRTVNNPLPSHF